jgi:hypothetical protein
MIDPAVHGTLLIGLAATRRQQDLSEMPVRPRPRQARGAGLRLALAAALRAIASAVEPRRPHPGLPV